MLKHVFGCEQVTASATENPDLFAAVKGAGTVFGVVVELAFKLVDVSRMYAGAVFAVDDAQGTGFK